MTVIAFDRLDSIILFENLDTSRCTLTSSLIYKTENGLAPAHLKQMFVKSLNLHSHDTASGQTAFSFYGASLWDQLPYEMKKAQILEFFQELIKGYIMNQ